MQWPLVLAGVAMGAASAPHCALMCAAPCAAVVQGAPDRGASFHVARLIGYAAGGALVAASVAALGTASQAAPVLRPLWTFLHLALLALGLWWLIAGTLVPQMQRGPSAVTVRVLPRGTAAVGGKSVLRSAGLGLLWVAWPCGMLQAALMTATLADDAVGGAAVMAGFALASSPGLVLGPLLWTWWRGRTQAWPQLAPQRLRALALDVRLPGLALVLASGWALTQGIWQKALAYCFG